MVGYVQTFETAPLIKTAMILKVLQDWDLKRNVKLRFNTGITVCEIQELVVISIQGLLPT